MPLPLPERDVRRKRPPVLMFLLRKETLRRIMRVLSLLVVGLRRRHRRHLHRHRHQAGAARATSASAAAWGNTRTPLAFAYLLTVLMFARVDLYADRPRRPGLPKIFGGAVPGDGDRAGVRAGHRQPLPELLHLLRRAVLRHRLHLDPARALHAGTGWLLEQAGYRRRALLVGSGKHIEEVAHALGGRVAHPGRARRLHLAHAAAPERPALPRPPRPAHRRARRRAHRRGDHRRSGLPPGARGRSRRPLPPAGRRPSTSRRRRWRS